MQELECEPREQVGMAHSIDFLRSAGWLLHGQKRGHQQPVRRCDRSNTREKEEGGRARRTTQLFSAKNVSDIQGRRGGRLGDGLEPLQLVPHRPAQCPLRRTSPLPLLFARSHLEQRPLAATHLLLLLSFFFFFLWSAEGADLHEPGRGVGVGEPLQIPPYHWVRQRALPCPFGANQNEQANRRQGLLFFLIYDARPLAKG